ncbi:LPXTG cell wall anchor domain-containing protein, partial [Fructobacillus cardui]|uniref:LPXTG cell wall anchor domain-containing protein n=1 Tax=Fructobacillus cardui TaxID=2893170 RepID=UPI0030C87B0B
KLGQLVPETLNHQPINDGQYNVGYPNDSNDPSKPSNLALPKTGRQDKGEVSIVVSFLASMFSGLILFISKKHQEDKK